MKKIAVLTLLCSLLFSACKKEECYCPQQVGSYYFSGRTNHYPINSTVLPSFLATNDTIILPGFISHRSYINDPPISSGQDYTRHETDQTEFRSLDFGIRYYSVAGYGLGPFSDASSKGSKRDKLYIDWFALEDYHTIYQKYSMDFLLPVDSNEITNELFIYDSLLVADTWYKNVLSGPVYKSFQTGPDYPAAFPERFYYSAEYGIVKFEMSAGTVWKIINLE